jgi:hypothetical protein
MAVAFDAIGAGSGSAAFYSSSPLTFSSTVTAGDTVLCVVGYINEANNSALTVSYGGQSMTQIGSAVSIGTSAPWYTFISMFYLANAAGGARTVTITPSVSATSGAKANIVSYTGVGSVGSLQSATGNGSSLSQTVTSATGHLVVQGFYQPFDTSAIASYNQTTRWNSIANGWTTALVIGEAAGASSVSFTASGSNGTSNIYGGVAVDLTPATVGKPISVSAMSQAVNRSAFF